MRHQRTGKLGRIGVGIVLAAGVCAIGLGVTNVGPLFAAEPAGAATSKAEGMPYIYAEWKHYTTKEGLPNDHVFAVKVDGDRVWIGTENGLACLNKTTGEIQSWTEEDGLPWRVVSAIDVDPDTGDVWLGMFGGGLARFSGGRFDHWHQLNSGLVNDVVYGVCVENDNIWAAKPLPPGYFGQFAQYRPIDRDGEEIHLAWNNQHRTRFRLP